MPAMVFESTVCEKEDKKEKFSSRVTFWLSVVLSTGIVLWYYNSNPPDDQATRNMRLFFKKNIMAVTEFLQLAPEDQKVFAEKHKNPFYENYVNASVIEKEKIRALVHLSYDYSPNQYWFNVSFLWTIAFTSFWFIGKIVEAILIIVRDEQSQQQ